MNLRQKAQAFFQAERAARGIVYATDDGRFAAYARIDDAYGFDAVFLGDYQTQELADQGTEYFNERRAAR